MERSASAATARKTKKTFAVAAWANILSPIGVLVDIVG
jgi:hypothetical protein